MSNESCSMCAEVAGTITAPGGVVFRDEWWEVAHHTGPWTDPGELIVKARPHVESLAALTPAGSAALGRVLRAAGAAVGRAVRPAAVCVARYGGRRGDVHCLRLPRTAPLPA